MDILNGDVTVTNLQWKNLIEQNQKKRLQLARNEAKERMFKSNTKVKYLSNSLKHKALDQDYENHHRHHW